MFEAGGLRTVEVIRSVIIGNPKSADGHHLLGMALSREEVVVVATILRLLNPNWCMGSRAPNPSYFLTALSKVSR